MLILCLPFQIENVDSPTLPKLFRDSQIDLPVIIKPQMACGVKDAHKMVKTEFA